jgi:hypothetical protein
MKARILVAVLLIVGFGFPQACADLLIFKDKSTAQATVLEFSIEEEEGKINGKFKFRLEGETAIKLYDAKDFKLIIFRAEAPKATPDEEDEEEEDEEEEDEKKAGKLSIKSSRWYTEGDYTYILGEVRNKGGSLLKGVRVVASIYDRQGNLLDTTFCYVDSIEPGEEEPFKMVMRTQKEFHNFKVKAKSRN